MSGKLVIDRIELKKLIDLAHTETNWQLRSKFELIVFKTITLLNQIKTNRLKDLKGK